MPDSKSCEHLERLAGAGARRREAEDARQRSVEELHREVASAREAPGCSHSHRDIAKAAGLSLGGVHNALLSVGSLDAAGSPAATGAPSPIPKARREAPPEPRSSEDERPATATPIPEARAEAPAEPRSSEDEPPAAGAPSPIPKARREAPVAPGSTTKLQSGTTVRKVERYATSGRRPAARRDASPKLRAGKVAAALKRPADELEGAGAKATGRGTAGQAPRRPPETVRPAPAAKRAEDHPGRSRREPGLSYIDFYLGTGAPRAPVKRRRRPPAEPARSSELYPGIY
jgi:hypothetical protein